MASSKWVDSRFGEQLKAERERRGWTQPQMAELLSDKGIAPMHATTIAKIEAGSRSVRINEAVGIADLFDVSLDSLLGRKQFTQDEQLAQDLRMLHDLANRCISEFGFMTREVGRLVHEAGVGGIPHEFVDDIRRLESDFDRLWLTMNEAMERLGNLSKGAEKILDRLEQRRKVEA